MDAYSETFETWNKLAAVYQEKFMDLPIYNQTYDAFCDLLIKNQPSVLEFGCGPGNITKYLLNQRPDFKILATDVAPAMVEATRRNNPSALVRLMDCREPNVGGEKFDAIVCGFCLPYLSQADIKKLIADCHNLLLGDGVIYLSFVDGAYSDSGFKSDGSGSRVYFYFHDTGWMQSVLVANNFEIRHNFEVPYPGKNGATDKHQIIIARKNTTK